MHGFGISLHGCQPQLPTSIAADNHWYHTEPVKRNAVFRRHAKAQANGQKWNKADSTYFSFGEILYAASLSEADWGAHSWSSPRIFERHFADWSLPSSPSTGATANICVIRSKWTLPRASTPSTSASYSRHCVEMRSYFIFDYHWSLGNDHYGSSLKPYSVCLLI
jgi:hypothetical protein